MSYSERLSDFFRCLFALLWRVFHDYPSWLASGIMGHELSETNADKQQCLAGWLRCDLAWHQSHQSSWSWWEWRMSILESLLGRLPLELLDAHLLSLSLSIFLFFRLPLSLSLSLSPSHRSCSAKKVRSFHGDGGAFWHDLGHLLRMHPALQASASVRKALALQPVPWSWRCIRSLNSADCSSVSKASQKLACDREVLGTTRRHAMLGPPGESNQFRPCGKWLGVSASRCATHTHTLPKQPHLQQLRGTPLWERSSAQRRELSWPRYSCAWREYAGSCRGSVLTAA